MGITTRLAEDLCNIQTLNEQDRKQLKLLLIDFLAASFAGYKQNREFNSAVEKIYFSQSGVKEAFVFLQKKKFPATKAAFINSVYAHGAELDDGNKKAMGHIGVHVIPSVFALADKLHSTQDEVLLGVATGYEAYIRISSAAQPGMVKRGFHSTGVAGTLACAAACARLFHMDAPGIEAAIALATTLTGGLLSYGDSRPAIKPLNPGKAAENGMFAAMLANEGVQGPTEALEGPNGWFHAVTDSVDETMLKGCNHLLLHDCYFKLYPSCRHTHCGIEAAINLHKKLNNLDEIELINVYIYPNAIRLAGQIRFPKNSDETKFSIHYTLACALLNGRYGISDMEVSNLSEKIIAVINKINLISDEIMEDRNRGIRGARIEATLKDGSIVEDTVLIPKGDPENPLTKDDILSKLRICAQNQVEEIMIKESVKLIEDIEGKNQFVNPMALMTGLSL
ncbi:MAG: MmgE/PrpD family protein [Acidaminococcaceae bacterium]|nr:MmgE/PrpD family protein [Acidaminococcaceae bacterium]